MTTWKRTSIQIHVPVDALAEVCRRYHVRELALFGSVLRDDFRADSDIDILVDYEPDAQVSLYEHYDLPMELEQLFDRPVDLISRRGLNSIIRNDILRSLQVRYAA